MPRSYNLRKHINASCLKCGAVEKEMVVTGCLHFCVKCYPTEFKSEHPSIFEKDNYQKWLRTQTEQMEEEGWLKN